MGTDRYPQNQASFPDPPPRTNGGTGPGGGGPPKRDRRRSRSQGDNLVASGSVQAIPTGGQGSLASTTGQLCTYDTGPDEGGEEAETLFTFLKAYDFAEGAVTGLPENALSPFAGVTSSIVPDGILQSLIVLAELQWGHDGTTEKVIANLAPGQIVKAGLAGSYARAHAKLSAKYLQRLSGTKFGGVVDNFFYIDNDPDIRNNIWNSLNSPAMQAILGFDPDTLPTTPIHIDGIISRGVATVSQGGSFDRSSRATRRFFGTFPHEAAAYPAGGAVVRCPIAFGAAAVMLQVNPTAFTAFRPAAIFGQVQAPLFFGMTDAAGNTSAQMPANTFFPLIDNCVEIFVYNPTLANGVENPFTLIYDLGL